MSERHHPTVAEIRAARKTRAQLAEWGVPWPPPKGWRRRLLAAAKSRVATIGAPPVDAAIYVWFDGCCEPRNPGGHAGYGAAIYRGKTLLHKISGFILASPETSNNVAEYLALGAALGWLLEQGLASERIHVRGDSKLVISQMWGNQRGRKWRIKAGLYVPYARRAAELLARFSAISGEWVPREENGLADRLSKRELLSRGVTFRIQPEGPAPGDPGR